MITIGYFELIFFQLTNAELTMICCGEPWNTAKCPWNSQIFFCGKLWTPTNYTAWPLSIQVHAELDRRVTSKINSWQLNPQVLHCESDALIRPPSYRVHTKISCMCVWRNSYTTVYQLLSR